MLNITVPISHETLTGFLCPIGGEGKEGRCNFQGHGREQLLGFPEELWLVPSSALTPSWSWARWSELTRHAFILFSLPKPLLCAWCWGFM